MPRLGAFLGALSIWRTLGGREGLCLSDLRASNHISQKLARSASWKVTVLHVL